MNTVNGNKPAAAATVAEQHREAYQRAAPKAQPARLAVWAKVRPWLLAGAVGLAAGAAAAFAVSYQVMPARATHVENVFTVIDGHPALILSGDVVFDSTPLPPTPAAQP